MKHRTAERKISQSGVRVENKPLPRSPFVQPKPFVKNKKRPKQN